ncbi:MAG TPA: LLM class F420-dependent oxidoreductase [Terriglobales bacterium]|jgi:probable F420-dependent oxidoreductase
MRIGFSLPNGGAIATPEAISKVARRAEELAYDSLWTFERVLYAVKPRDPYPGMPDGKWPELFRRMLDPLDALTFAAAQTKKIVLGTSVLDIPYYNPVMLARRLATMDYLSNGRLRVGLGLGWSKDEMEATNADMKTRGALADEFLQVLKAVWTQNPVEFKGKFYSLPNSYIDLKPVQKPHPPIYLAAFAPVALQRLAKVADGWNPVAIPPQGMAQMFGSIKRMAKDAGRDPSRLEMVVRANLHITDKPLGKDRLIFTGTLDQVKEDTEACQQIGAHEVHFDPGFEPGKITLEGWLKLMEQLRGFVQ